jgi:hypothetical protein
MKKTCLIPVVTAGMLTAGSAFLILLPTASVSAMEDLGPFTGPQTEGPSSSSEAACEGPLAIADQGPQKLIRGGDSHVILVLGTCNSKNVGPGDPSGCASGSKCSVEDSVCGEGKKCQTVNSEGTCRCSCR